MKCGNCGDVNATVEQVRACYAARYAPTGQDFVPEPVAKPVAKPAAPTGRSLYDALREVAAKLPDEKTAYYAVGVLDYTEIDSAGDNICKTVWEFYRVDKPQTGKWTGAVFVKKQAGDDFWHVGPERALMVLEAIAADPRAAGIEYGKRIGRCSICGRTLTVPESIEAGIGPVCAERMGW